MGQHLAYSAKELHKLAVARCDIVEARLACERMGQTVTGIDDPMYYPLFVMTVVCYARPFTNNSLLGRLGKKWTRFPDAPLQKMHRTLVKARNTLIAHSDGEVRKVQIVPKGYRVPGTDKVSQDHTCLVRKLFFPLENFPLAKRLCQFQIGRMNPQIQELLGEVVPHLNLTEGPTEMDFQDFMGQ